MRIVLVSALLLSSAVAALAQTAPAPSAVGAGVGSAGPLQTFDVPTDKPQETYILHRVLKPGQSIGRHYHDGVEITQVISGDLRLMVDGRETRIYHGGDSFQIPRGTPHDSKNIGTTDLSIAVTYVLDRGAPLLVYCTDATKACGK